MFRKLKKSYSPKMIAEAMDDEIRDAERDVAAGRGGDEDAEATLLNLQLKAGQITREKVEALARLGHEPARRLHSQEELDEKLTPLEPVPSPPEGRNQERQYGRIRIRNRDGVRIPGLQNLLVRSGLTANEIVNFAIDCARQVLPLFKEQFPGDNGPEDAIEAAEETVAAYNAAATDLGSREQAPGPHAALRLAAADARLSGLHARDAVAAADAAADAALWFAANLADQTYGSDAAAIQAIQAAIQAAYAAYAAYAAIQAAYALSFTTGADLYVAAADATYATYATYAAARAASYAVAAAGDDRSWVINRLRQYLLGRREV